MHFLDNVKRSISKIKFNLMHHYFNGVPSKQLMDWFDNPNDTVISKWWTPGIPNIDDVLHGATCPKNKTVKWFGMDSPDEYAKSKQTVINKNGEDKVTPTIDQWLFTEDNVNYTFNSLGYRGDEPAMHIDADFTALVCSDSHGFGIGLDDAQVWPAVLKQQLTQQYKNPVVINISCPGASNDWIARAITCTLEKIRPNVVVAVYSYPNRREAISSRGSLWELGTSLPTPGFGISPQDHADIQMHFTTINDYEDYYNMSKNHWMIKTACENKHVPLVTSHVQQMQVIQREQTHHTFFDVARDLKHFGPTVHKTFAQDIYAKIQQ